MTFDLNSIIPEGWECVGVRQVERGESYLEVWHKEPFEWTSEYPSSHKYVIIRKKWTPKPGELVAVRGIGDLPAFPTDNEAQVGPNIYHFSGMTLRQYYAGLAMQGLLARYGNDDDRLANWALREADALIAELDKQS